MAGRSVSCRWACSVLAIVLTAADWPCFLGLNRDGSSPEVGVKPWPAGGPKLVWKVSTGEGYSAPSVVGGRVYYFDRVGGSCRLRCLDAATGREIWQYAYATNYADKYGYDGGPRTSPVIADGRVFVYGPEGQLHALTTDGKPIWKVNCAREYDVVQNFFGVGSTPLVEGNLLIVSVGGSPTGVEPDDFRQLKGNGSGIVAFNVATGREVYKSGDDLASYTSPVPVTIRGQRRIAYWARNDFITFDPNNGKIDTRYRWRSDILESVNAANPVFHGDRVLLSHCYGGGAVLLQLNEAGPKVAWRDDDRRRVTLGCHWATPVYADGHVFACSGRNASDAELRCVEFATGVVKWREPGLARSQLLLVDRHLVALTEYGVLLLLKATPDRYQELCRADFGPYGTKLLKPPSWAGPVLADGRLYLRGDGVLACLELIPKPSE